MSTSINIVSGLGIPSQIPLNPKENSASEATLKDLGLNNNLAFTYEKGLQVYCRLEGTRYEWREVAIGEELSGLRDTDFTYPSGTITDGVDYSNKKYNFFPVITTALTNEVFIEQGDNITITGTGVELDPFIINGLISPLNKINEGNGDGIIIRDRISTNYGNIGLNAVDFSYNDITSSTKGATGENSFTINKSNTSSGENSFTGGLNNTASELNSFSFGENNESNKTNSISLGSSIISSGISAIGIGKGLNSKSFSEIVLGSYNSNYNPISELTWSVTDRLFTIGNGFNEFNRSDAVLIYKNGLALLPTVTNSLIENATGKAIITKEYLESILPTTVDGSETKLQAGVNINIIGNGTVTTPYIISSTNEDISQYTNELAIDAVGSVLQNSNTIIFNYDSITPSISADVDINAISSNTGILYGGELSINTNDTFWDISEGVGYIADSLLRTTTKVVWNTMLSNEVDNLSTSLSTYILIDINGNIVQQINPPSPEQYRTHIYIGIIDHGSLTNISSISNETSRMFDISGQIEDLNIALGPINIGNGNIFTYNGSNLNINVSEGSTYRSGSNYITNRFSPSITTEPAVTIANFKRKYRTGVGTWNEVTTSIIDPNYFDNNSGALVTVPTGKFTIQTLWRFGNSGIINIDYGQQFYDTLGQAKASIGSDYVEYDEVNLKSASRRGWLILKQGITDLSIVGDALFIQADRFGDKLEIGDIFNLQSAYNNSSLPEILTNNTLGAFSIRRGSALDSDNVLEISNNIGDIKSSFTGDGKITATSFIKTNGLSTEILLANGDSESKNTGFNKPFGTIANTVSEGNHTHTFASLTSKPTTLAGYGITDAVADTIVDGVTITAPSQNIVYEALQKKVNLPTGFISGLQLSINIDPSKFNIAPGYYTITDFTDLNNPIVTFKTFVGINGVSPAYLTTANASYIALDIDGNVIQSASPFSNTDRRTLAIIGSTIHSNNITINVTNEIKAPIMATLNQLHDFMRAVGFLNEEGNIYGANGANLQLNKSVGKIFGLGINASNYLNPHELSIPAQTALTFAYRLRGGTQFTDTQNIDPNNYDNNGVLTNVTAGNKWTIQHINLFQSGLTRIQYGQTVYNSYNEAVTALPTDPFITEQNIADNAIFRSYLIIKQGTTNIATAISGGTALFVPVDKFGNVIGNGAIALTYSNIIAALGYTPENVANKVTDISIGANNTTYPTSLAVKSYADNLVVGMLNDRGTWDASVNAFPTTGGSGTSGAIRKGDMWYVSVAGNLGGKAVGVGDSFRALVNSPAQVTTNWSVLEANIGYVPANDVSVVHLAGAETISGLKKYLTRIDLNDGLEFTGGVAPNPFANAYISKDPISKNIWMNTGGKYSYIFDGSLLSTASRTYTFPNASGTFALTSDLKSFGTTAGTVAEGNDSRILNGQTAFGWGNHAGLYLPLTGGVMNGIIDRSPSGSGTVLAPYYDKVLTYANIAGSISFGNSGNEDNGTYIKMSTNSRLSGNTPIDNLILSPEESTFSTKITALGGNSTNWNTAFGWGDHAGKYVLNDGSGKANPNTQLQSSSYRFDPNANNPTNDYYAISTYGNNFNVVGQLATHYSTGQTYTRGNAGTGWYPWKKLLDDSNFNSYAAPLNGTGATGTWGINVSGNAASASNWGGRTANLLTESSAMTRLISVDNDGVAKLATVANTVSFLGLGSNAFSNVAYLPINDGSRADFDFNSKVTSGFYNSSGGSSSAPSGAGLYGQLISAKGSDTGFQMYGGWNTDNMWFRGWTDSGSTFTPWRKIWHDGNFNPANYLPLTGGTLSNNLKVSGGYGIGYVLEDGFSITRESGATRLSYGSVGRLDINSSGISIYGSTTSTGPFIANIVSSGVAGEVNNQTSFRSYSSGNIQYGIGVPAATGGMDYMANQSAIGAAHRFYGGRDNDNPKLLFSIQSNGNLDALGNITSAGFFQSSDRRLKYIHKRDGDVAYFTWKDGRDTKEHIGYVAQEVRKQFPDQVQADDKGVLSVNYVEILVEKIRLLEKRLEILEGGKNGI